jgi:hypothetical protein
MSVLHQLVVYQVSQLHHNESIILIRWVNLGSSLVFLTKTTPDFADFL